MSHRTKVLYVEKRDNTEELINDIPEICHLMDDVVRIVRVELDGLPEDVDKAVDEVKSRVSVLWEDDAEDE